MSEPELFSRREMLRVTARGLGSLFTVGLWPGAVRAKEAGEFVFVVANDLHYRDTRCAPWTEALVRTMKKHRPEFCVINGDLSENGTPEQLGNVREIFSILGAPVFVTIGNHDYREDDSRAAFEDVFPRSINYHFEHKGWQFVAMDSTQGQQVFYTRVQDAPLRWLGEALPRLDRNRPTVLLTHFPLGSRVICRPRNAPAVLERFHHHNLRAVMNGHWHGYSLRETRGITVTTNRCCSWWRINNDGSDQKGFFLCRATSDGQIVREFCGIRASA